MRRIIHAALASLVLAACAPAGQSGDESAATPETALTPTGEPAPEIFSATAWRAVAEDGARYTTYLDPDGTYRDLRNGDPWQTGSWTYDEGARPKLLCFTPDDENAIERCWEPGRMSGDTMRAESDGGLTIELERVDYELPAEGEPAEDEPEA
jgi:hypothetical protein